MVEINTNTNMVYKNCSAKMKHYNTPAFSGITINSKTTASSLKWLNDNVASHHQRLILGATAITSQPFIDLNNKNVDEQTRKISCAKTMAKIIAGTSTGFFVRWACTKLAQNYTQVDNFGKKASTKSFLAPSLMKNFSKDKRVQYVNAIGAILGVLACVFTNFLIDAPLTKHLTNHFSAKINDKYKAKGEHK